MYNNTVWT